MKIQLYAVRLKRAGTLAVSDAKASSFDASSRILLDLMRGAASEEFWVLSLNSAHDVVGAEKVASGGLAGCSVSAREVFRGAIMRNASAVIVSHNHPSGNPMPSPEDVAMTRTLIKAGDLLGIVVVDHVVVCPTNGTSRSVMDYVGAVS